MYKCEYFSTKELVSPKVYAARGDKSIQLMDERILKVADLLREHFGSCVINDWSWGGKFKNSGLRTSFSTWWRRYSQHSYGRALDLKFEDHSAFSVRNDILLNWDKKWAFLFESIGVDSITMETGETVTWVHIDIRNNYKGVNTFAI